MLNSLSYLEISAENVISNFLALKSKLHPDTKISCALKGNAYGHGQNEIAKILEPYVDYFQLDDLQELRVLRSISNKPALVLGFVEKSGLEEAIKLNCSLAVYDKEHLLVLNQIAERLNVIQPVQVKIDAHLGREGILLSTVGDFFETLKSCQNLSLEGVYAHFANIEDTSDFAHAQKQIDNYQEALKIIKDAGFHDFLTHISSTAGSLVYEKDQGIQSMVRLGIGVFGMWPSEELRGRYENDKLLLKPVHRWVTHVAQVKTLPEDYSIGYGLTYITSKETTIAVVPQGYSDGYDRGLSNCGEVLIQGSRCRILGRVAMNMFVVDISHLKDVTSEDEVVLLGKQGEEEITAEELASKISTINYEVTARISPLLDRIII